MVFLFSVGMYETPFASFWFMYKDKPPKVRFPDLFLHLTDMPFLLGGGGGGGGGRGCYGFSENEITFF